MEDEYSVFTFCQEVAEKDYKKAFDTLEKLKMRGEVSVNILGALYNKLKTIMLIQCCKSSDIENVTGLSRGEVYYNKKNVGIYKTSELVNAVKIIEDVTEKVKLGQIEDDLAIEYILVRINQ